MAEIVHKLAKKESHLSFLHHRLEIANLTLPYLQVSLALSLFSHDLLMFPR